MVVGRSVDVGARVSQYEVTSTPLLGAVGRGRLRLVWVRSTEPEVAEAPAGAAENAGLAVLDAYRITRVPERVLRVAS